MQAALDNMNDGGISSLNPEAEEFDPTGRNKYAQTNINSTNLGRLKTARDVVNYFGQNMGTKPGVSSFSIGSQATEPMRDFSTSMRPNELLANTSSQTNPRFDTATATQTNPRFDTATATQTNRSETDSATQTSDGDVNRTSAQEWKDRLAQLDSKPIDPLSLAYLYTQIAQRVHFNGIVSSAMNWGRDAQITNSMQNFQRGQNDTDRQLQKDLQSNSFSNAQSMQQSGFENQRNMQSADFANAQTMQGRNFDNQNKMQQADFTHQDIMQTAGFKNANQMQDKDIANKQTMQNRDIANQNVMQNKNIMNSQFMQGKDIANQQYMQSANISNQNQMQRSDQNFQIGMLASNQQFSSQMSDKTFGQNKALTSMNIVGNMANTALGGAIGVAGSLASKGMDMAIQKQAFNQQSSLMTQRYNQSIQASGSQAGALKLTN